MQEADAETCTKAYLPSPMLVLNWAIQRLYRFGSLSGFKRATDVSGLFSKYAIHRSADTVLWRALDL